MDRLCYTGEKNLKESSPGLQFSLESIAGIDGKVAFCTEFPSFNHLI